MSRAATFFTILVFFGLVMDDAWSEPGQQAPDYGESAYQRSIRWTSPSGERSTPGLFLFDMTSAGMVNRILAQDPAGRPLILTWTLDALHGKEWSELLDDETGWRVRLEVDTGVKAKHLGAYFAAAMRDLRPELGASFNLTLTTPGGLYFERELPMLKWSERPYRAFGTALGTTDSADGLVASIPAGLSDAIFFLDSSMSPGPGPQEGSENTIARPMRGVIEVLATVLETTRREAVGAPDEAEVEPWVMTVSEGRKGIGVVDPNLLGLVSRFRSVENADPLSDHRAREVLSQDRDPNP